MLSHATRIPPIVNVKTFSLNQVKYVCYNKHNYDYKIKCIYVTYFVLNNKN